MLIIYHFNVQKWVKGIGDEVVGSDIICEVTLDDLTIGIEAHFDGVLATIEASEGSVIDVGKTLATVAPSIEEYESFMALTLEHNSSSSNSNSNSNNAVNSMAGEVMAKSNNSNSNNPAAQEILVQKVIVELEKKISDSTVPHSDSEGDSIVDTPFPIILRHVKHLIQNGTIDENSEFCSDLRRLIRKENKFIRVTFDASFEGEVFNEESFDNKFFLQGAADIIEDMKEADAASTK